MLLVSRPVKPQNALELKCPSVIAFLFFIYFLFKYDLDRNTICPKFDPTGVQTHDLQIIGSTFHVPGTLALTTELSRTSVHLALCLLVVISQS